MGTLTAPHTHTHLTWRLKNLTCVEDVPISLFSDHKEMTVIG